MPFSILGLALFHIGQRALDDNSLDMEKGMHLSIYHI
jgi:hypothetical protein